MSEKRDFYDVLGVSRSAGSDEIRKAYRKAALKYHPDRNQGDEEASEKFKEATEAYSVLSDAQKRQIYDQFGHAGLEGQGAGGGVGFGGEDMFSHLQDLFGDLFGGMGGRARRQRNNGPRRGDDLRVVETLTLEEAFQGCKREIPIRADQPCERCGGSGVKSGSSPQTCARCGGSGQVGQQRGFMVFATTCPACQGRGQVITDPCEACHGTGAVERSRKVVVTFPPGIDGGQRLRVPGKGVPGPHGGPAGDLYVDVQIEPHDKFERHGADLVTHVFINFSVASLGGKVPIELLDGETFDLKIPAGTQSESILRVPGRGMPSVNGRRGSGTLHVVAHVRVPKRLSRKAKKLIKELAGELDNKVQQSSTGE